MPHLVRVVKGVFAKSEGMRPMQVVEKPSYTVSDWLVDRYLQPIVDQANDEARQRAEREHDPVRRGFRYLSDTAWLASPWRP